jgi:hypothetical protein
MHSLKFMERRSSGSFGAVSTPGIVSSSSHARVDEMQAEGNENAVFECLHFPQH